MVPITSHFTRIIYNANKIKLLKTDISVCTAAPLTDKGSQRLLHVTTFGGTPLLKMFWCCLPFGSSQDKHVIPPLKETMARSPPPIVMTKISSDDETTLNSELEPMPDKILAVPKEEETTLFDTGVLCQIAILGGFLVGQAFNVLYRLSSATQHLPKNHVN